MKQTVLLVKTSSLGDVLHLLPALSDARRCVPDLVFHWVIEENLAEVASWHPSVEKVIPVALRRWRKHPWQAVQSGEFSQFVHTLRAETYRWILDAQGLVKSALIARLAHGWRIGLDRHSAREPLASWMYQTPLFIPPAHHALDRLRQLMATGFHYSLPLSPPDYGLADRFSMHKSGEPYWVFLSGTTWPSKHWPEAYWLDLVRLCAPHGKIVLPWGTDRELARARRIAQVAAGSAFLTEKTNLTQLATLLAGARAVVAVDTGPAHLAAAVGRPVIGLYGPTDPQRVGTLGRGQRHVQGECDLIACKKRICPLQSGSVLHPPCFQSISPERVWQMLREVS